MRVVGIKKFYAMRVGRWTVTRRCIGPHLHEVQVWWRTGCFALRCR